MCFKAVRHHFTFDSNYRKIGINIRHTLEPPKSCDVGKSIPDLRAGSNMLHNARKFIHFVVIIILCKDGYGAVNRPEINETCEYW